MNSFTLHHGQYVLFFFVFTRLYGFFFFPSWYHPPLILPRLSHTIFPQKAVVAALFFVVNLESLFFCRRVLDADRSVVLTPLLDMMPRVCFLAESGSDRQAKVAACEFLHAITIYLVGSHAQHKIKSSYENVYKHIFPVIIRLSVDVEQITRQLFEPLAFQLVRWFTKNQRAENKETMALLESIIDAAGNPTDGALRETSAKLLTEFLKWSIKHAPPAPKSSDDPSPFNALSLFKRLYSMASHPSPYKRLGCALALKQMYRVFREDETLVSLFVLEMAHVVLVSLRHATNDSDALGTVQLYTQVLEALGRIIVAYKVKLSKEEPSRRMHKSLASLLRFVFSQCGRPERPVRHAAFTMFHAMVLHIPGHKTPAEWVNVQISKASSDMQVSTVRDAVVKYFDDPNLLRRVPDMPVSEEVSARQNFVLRAQNWYQQLGSSLDGLVWLLSSDLISPEVLLGGDSLECSRPMSMANAFIEKFAMIDVDDAVFSTLTPAESEKFNATKCYLRT
jgi:DNA-dependent protein kinase catalytic subunit